MRRRTLFLSGLLGLLCGCGSAPLVPPQTPQPTPAEATAPAVAPTPAEPLVRTAPAPDYCTVDASPAPGAPCPTTSTEQLERLDIALSAGDPKARDLALLALGQCSVYETGLILALRAELVPVECADVLIDPWLTEPPASLTLELSQLHKGLSLAAKLARTSSEPPRLPEPFTREDFQAFLENSLRPFFVSQARLIEGLALQGARLSGYGKAIAAIEAGMADLRFVENIRAIPLPVELSSDPELSEAYHQSLEEALEPRKVRGRDAMLVGLLNLSRFGVLDDPRLARARAKLVRIFSGSRIDALDSLLLPPLPSEPNSSVAARLAAVLPTFYTERLLGGGSWLEPSMLRAGLVKGLPPSAQRQLDQAGRLPPEVGRLYARALLELGRRYFRPSDFARASELARGAAGAGVGRSEAELLGALALALRGGPENAVQLMLTGPMLPEGMGDVTALDALAKQANELGGMAAFDAAHILSILPQANPDPELWHGIQRRFQRAAELLRNPEQKAQAKVRAEDAAAVAREIASVNGTNPKP